MGQVCGVLGHESAQHAKPSKVGHAPQAVTGCLARAHVLLPNPWRATGRHTHGAKEGVLWGNSIACCY